MEDLTLIAIAGIAGLAVVWTVNCLTLKLDSVLASAIVSSITGIVTYAMGYRRGSKRASK